MSALPDTLVAFVRDCTVELAASLGLGAYREVGAAGPVTADLLAAVVGFTDARLSGSLVIMATADGLRRSHPNAAMGMPIDDRDVSDWIGELANQLLGRVKNRVVRCGLEFSMTTPTVMSGGGIHLREVKGQDAQDLCFDGAFGMIAVRFAAQIAPDVSFVESQQEATAAEGASLLF
jgi:hypothetical protein